MATASLLYESVSATFSLCETYRYQLERWWWRGRKLTFIMLNPSTATALVNDPTVGRCEARAVRDGYGGFEVVNLFALRSTDPGMIKKHPDPVGPDNDAAILDACSDADMVICAWGKHGRYRERDKHVMRLLNGIPLYCLGINGDGTPKHPLYLKSDLNPVLFVDSDGVDVRIAQPDNGGDSTLPVDSP